MMSTQEARIFRVHSFPSVECDFHSDGCSNTLDLEGYSMSYFTFLWWWSPWSQEKTKEMGRFRTTEMSEVRAIKTQFFVPYILNWTTSKGSLQIYLDKTNQLFCDWTEMTLVSLHSQWFRPLAMDSKNNLSLTKAKGRLENFSSSILIFWNKFSNSMLSTFFILPGDMIHDGTTSISEETRPAELTVENVVF